MMIVKVIKVDDYEEMSEKACIWFMERLVHLESPVLGLATGSTPEGLYECLIEQHKRGKISFEKATTFNLDEYVGLATDHPNSYNHYMYEKLFSHIAIQADQAHLTNGLAKDLDKECRDYEQLIAQVNNIDIQLLGVGVNGHIAFNEPGTSFNSRTHVIELDEATRRSNARFFDRMDQVPTQAITMGIETIMESKEIIMLVSGENKADALARVINGTVTEDCPASVLQRHSDVTIIADRAALSKA